MACMAQFQPALPVIYLTENNQYGMTGQQVGEVTGVDHLARRGAGYNEQMMHGEVVSGMDVLAVRDAVSRAAALCRQGEGPVLLEALTYRYMGHSLSDLRASYRSAEEEERWKACDAIETYRRRLVESGLMGEAESEELEAKVRQVIQAATDRAAHGTDPDPATIYEGLWANTTSQKIAKDLKTQLDKPPRRPQRDREGKIFYRHAVWEALMEEMVRDRRVVLYGEDATAFSILRSRRRPSSARRQVPP
jgi:2-oxoisovalerate dehydrogenase E1 component